MTDKEKYERLVLLLKKIAEGSCGECAACEVYSILEECGETIGETGAGLADKDKSHE